MILDERRESIETKKPIDGILALSKNAYFQNFDFNRPLIIVFPASKSCLKNTKPADNSYRGLTESFSSSPAKEKGHPTHD